MTEASRKDRILIVAEKLFRHYGPQKTTMVDIAREANVGVGSVYLDFPSKEAILAELSRKRGGMVASMMRSAAEGAEHPERLRRMLEARVAALLILAGEGAHACDILHCGPKEPIGFGEAARDLVRSEIEDGIRQGVLRCEVDPTMRAIEIAFIALSPPYLFRFDRRDAAELAEGVARLIVYGLGGASSGARTSNPTGPTAERLVAEAAPPAPVKARRSRP